MHSLETMKQLNEEAAKKEEKRDASTFKGRKTMLPRINLDAHVGYFRGKESQKISNGEIGVGFDNKERILVVCCSNCGDYSHINLEELLLDLPRKERGGTK